MFVGTCHSCGKKELYYEEIPFGDSSSDDPEEQERRLTGFLNCHDQGLHNRANRDERDLSDSDRGRARDHFYCALDAVDSPSPPYHLPQMGLLFNNRFVVQPPRAIWDTMSSDEEEEMEWCELFPFALCPMIEPEDDRRTPVFKDQYCSPLESEYWSEDVGRWSSDPADPCAYVDDNDSDLWP